MTPCPGICRNCVCVSHQISVTTTFDKSAPAEAPLPSNTGHYVVRVGLVHFHAQYSRQVQKQQAPNIFSATHAAQNSTIERTEAHVMHVQQRAPSFIETERNPASIQWGEPD
eukprot:gb/GFBE01015298.1/.p1 GENE.gb/GFBE01015298.1/~~gb/GFBE01015298.1/.p1  ORF type:complete len:112 (+),score=9.25 gb/GFBE01015298.1/:1-336(+)